jgi:hypothetical protein
MTKSPKKENKLNNYLKFIAKVFLKHLVWIFPLLYIGFNVNLEFGFFALCLIISFTYWEFEKFKLPFKLKIHITNSTIKLFYNLAVWPLFFLTALAIFEGIRNNYSTGDNLVDFIFPLFYSIGLTSILIALTSMIKTGKKWVILALIYILFDFPGAMPYNYLFFHEKLKAQNGFDVDLKEYKNQLDSTSVLIDPIFKNLNEKASQCSSNIKYKKDEIDEIEAEKRNYDTDGNKPESQKHSKALNKLNKKLSELNQLNQEKAILESKIESKYDFDTLKKLWTDSIANLSLKRTARIQAMNEFKKDLNSFTNALIFPEKESEINALKANIKKIDPIQKTQLEVIQDLFIYTKNLVGIPTYTKNLVGIKTKKVLTPEDNNFIEMCLLPSIIIDLLPLLFSIVYAKWNETQETLEQ